MNWTFTSEENLASTFATHINPFWQESVTESHFTGKDDIKVRYAYCIPETPRATIVICSGRIESYLKYKEFIYDLYQMALPFLFLITEGKVFQTE